MGRPRKYSSDDERRKIYAQKFREKYVSKKRNSPNKTDHPSYEIWCNAKKRAREQEVEFTLDLDDIVIPEICPLLKIPLIKGIKVYTDNSPTLDKIMPSLGYVKGNTQVISMRANRIKNDSTFKEFEMIYLAWKSQRDNI